MGTLVFLCCESEGQKPISEIGRVPTGDSLWQSKQSLETVRCENEEYITWRFLSAIRRASQPRPPTIKLIKIIKAIKLAMARNNKQKTKECPEPHTHHHYVRHPLPLSTSCSLSNSNPLSTTGATPQWFPPPIPSPRTISLHPHALRNPHSWAEGKETGS